MRERYAAQVRLLVRLIPFVAEEPELALKGGTAINLFYRNLPRYSVDIDLIYLPIKDRAESLEAIATALERLANRIEGAIAGARATIVSGGGNQETRIIARTPEAQVKIEVSPVMRGTLSPPKPMTVHEAVEEEFGFAEMPVISFEEIFAGKIIAALDRAHPRDLFDVHHLLHGEGITDALFQATLIYLISSNRPMHELLDPGAIDLSDIYTREFEGMTAKPLPLETLYAARERLVSELRSKLTGDAAAFLEGVHICEPDFDLIGLPQAADLPAVRWKLLNLGKFKANEPERHADQLEALQALFLVES
ncbi:nucleotidyl transferase AbiEii/AbiGii toxin family protein [Hyphobacterium indicum]|uniref:nucleotidyl transferase AbiEii/AbiGii toxin family protein n=1 Tax=Hyphobacterium indicum TaxID=2162714 RepID=UPI000D65DB8A|nr:nucleotidyl transferase AbiEii/AbiGii toxin family protein [Hyphobacterium indicum]